MNELRRIRSMLQLSQRAFATRLGVSPNTYRPWDTDRRKVPWDVLRQARAVLRHELQNTCCPSRHSRSTWVSTRARCGQPLEMGASPWRR